MQFAAASDQSWLIVAGSGTATSAAPASLAFSTDSSGLKPGVYTAHITVSDSGSGAQSVVTVLLAVANSGAPSVQLSRTGITLTGVAGGVAPQAHVVTVTNSGSGTLNWTVRSSTTSGGDWLTTTITSTSISISANTRGLAEGHYFGSVNVVAANATNSPQVVTVALDVVGATASPAVLVSTGGVLLLGAAGSAVPARQSIGLYNAGSSAITYSASAFAANGTWLSASPSSGVINQGSGTIQISADLSGLAAGVQSGTVTLAFGDGSTASIGVITLVLGKSANSSGDFRPLASAGACHAGKAGYLIPIFRQPSSQTFAQVATATTVQAQVIDDCGNAVTNGSVQATFSNGDPGISLNSIGAGIWETTWIPRNAAIATAIQLSAASNGLTGNVSLSSLSSETVNVLAADANAAPLPTGIANAASAAQATPGVVSPGTYIAIYGKGLAGTENPSATSLPLPTTLNGAQLFLGGLPMPLLYASAGQVNALVPQGIVPNAAYPLVVVRGTTQSAPMLLTVTELQPGAYTVNTSGSGAGVVANAQTGTLITAANPARAGDYLVIYGTGLGALTGSHGEAQPGDGAIAPNTILYQTIAKVTVTIGGVNAPVIFSGLTPTLAGLYQVNVQVPTGVAAGTAVPLIIAATDPANGVSTTGNTVTIAVR